MYASTVEYTGQVTFYMVSSNTRQGFSGLEVELYFITLAKKRRATPTPPPKKEEENDYPFLTQKYWTW